MGQQVSIVAPASGKLSDWTGTVGSSFGKDDQIGAIMSAGSGAGGSQEISVTVPNNGTVVQSGSVKDSFVAAGTPLAQMFDLSNLWVTANIEETDLNGIEIGQNVDIYVFMSMLILTIL
ncbi:nicotinate phosphoribosyltransferase [Bacillus sp. 1NLA3E]|nr:nicotinate phosphoribosyltransferase [Bacillus sp. 1NLA3E]